MRQRRVDKIDHVIFPEGVRVDYTYDLYGNATKIQDNAGNSMNYFL